MRDDDRRSRTAAGFALATLLLALLAAFVLWLLDAPAPPQVRIQEPDAPPALAPDATRPLQEPLRIRALDIRGTTRDGIRFSAPAAEAVATPEGLGLAGRAGAGAGSGAAAGAGAAGIRLDTVRIVGGRVRQPAPPDQAGRWAWDLREVELRLTDVRLGGAADAPARADVRLSLEGRVRGQEIRVRGIIASVSGRPGRVRARGSGRVASGAATLQARGGLVLGDDPRASGLVLRLASVDAALLRRLGVDGVPAGEYAGRVRLDGPPRRLDLDARLRRTAGGRTSRLRAAGWVRATPERAVDLRVTASPVIVADTPVVALLRLRGPVDSMAVAGSLALLATGGSAATTPRASRFPAPVAGGASDSVLVPPAPSAAAPVTARLAGHILDGLGTPRIAGTLRLAADPAGLGLRSGPPLRAEVRGRVAPGADGLDAAVRLDSVPLRVLRLPAAIRDVRGAATASLQLAGALDAPTVAGTIRLHGSARVPEHDLAVRDVDGLIRLTDGAIRFDSVTAAIGGGTVRLRGSVTPGDVRGIRIRGGRADAARRVDLVVTTDSVRVLDRPLARVSASGRVTLRGPLERPVVGGRIRPAGWVREDFFLPDPGLDLDDPPYADLARRAPWPERRLLRAAARSGGGPLDAIPLVDGVRGELVLEVTPALELLDEDSRVVGTGEVVLRLDDGLETAGVVAIQDGFYAQFGQRFRVFGGAFVFDGPGLLPRVAIRSDYQDEAPLIGDNEAPPKPARFPPIQFLGYGRVDEGRPRENVTRYVLMPRTQLQYARLIQLDNDPGPVKGWRYDRVWRSHASSSLVGERALTQGVSLGWSYVGDRLYDFIPLDVAYLRARIASVGTPYPGELVVAPLVRGSLVLSDAFEARAAQPVVTTPPELVLVYHRGELRFEAFTGPRFHAGLSLGGESPGFETRRRTGISVLWGLGF